MRENTTEEVKPCPFCGGAGQFEESRRYPGFGYYHCSKCGASADCGIDPRDEALAKWNRRANDE